MPLQRAVGLLLLAAACISIPGRPPQAQTACHASAQYLLYLTFHQSWPRMCVRAPYTCAHAPTRLTRPILPARLPACLPASQLLLPTGNC